MTGTRFSLEVQPRIPERIKRLEELANDLLYSWDSQVRQLFVRLDQDLWERCGHNPKVFLRRVAQHNLENATADSIYVQDYDRILASYDAYHHISRGTKYELDTLLDPQHDLIA